MNKYITSNKVFWHGRHIEAYKRIMANRNFKNYIGPVSVEIHPTNRCNNKCTYCGMARVRGSDSQDGDGLLESIAFCNDVGAKSIYFSGGGEPTILHIDLMMAMQEAFPFFEIGLITNGIICDIDYSTWCEWIRISLDTIDPRAYEKIRGVDAFDVVDKNIIKLNDRRQGCTIGLQVVVCEDNYMNLFWTIKDMLERYQGIDYIQIRPIESVDFPYKEDVFGYTLNTLDHIREKINSPRIIISDKWDLLRGAKSAPYGVCHATAFIGLIDARGDYYVCCHMIGNEKYKLGNVFSGFNFKEAYEKFVEENPTLGYDPAICPVGCRGSGINTSIELLRNNPHKNFL